MFFSFPVQMTSAPRAKQPAAIFPLMATGLGLTFMAIVAFRFYVNPYLAKKNRAKSQEYANLLWEQEHRPKTEPE